MAHSLHFGGQGGAAEYDIIPMSRAKRFPRSQLPLAISKYDVPRGNDETYFTPGWPAAISPDKRFGGQSAILVATSNLWQPDERMNNYPPTLRQPFSPGPGAPVPTCLKCADTGREGQEDGRDSAGG